MKTTHFFVAALGLAAGLAASGAFAQTGMAPTRSQQPAQPARQAAALQIAVIDISRVFKEHPRFIDEMARLKVRVEQEDAKMKLRAESLQNNVDVLKSLTPGSQDYKAKEKALASERAQMQIDIQAQRKEFLQQEAAIYRVVYDDVKREVDNYASTYGLAAVVRYASQPEEADPNQPEVVLREIQKDLVWFNPLLDITPQILGGLKARNATASTGVPSRPGVPRPPQNATRPSTGYRQ